MVAIQGGLVMAQATDDTSVFKQAVSDAKKMMLEMLKVDTEINTSSSDCKSLKSKRSSHYCD